MPSKAIKNVVIIAIIVLIILGLGSYFTVKESHRALVMRMGRFIKQPGTDIPQVYKPGLHFKAPFIDSANRFDFRLKTMDVQSSRILTEQQKYVLVDYYVKWRINDLPEFYKSTKGDPARAERLLQQKINDALRAAFGNRQIMEVVAGERVDVMQKLQKEAKESAGNLGINVIDVRIKRIDLPTNVSNSVFNRMRTERQQYATLYRSRGKADAEKVRAKADKESAIIEAEARRKAAAIRGEGMNKAATTYANAYQQDVDFYTFYRAMQAYKQVFGHKDDVMVLTPNSEFMHYFKDLPKATEANQ